MRRPTRWRLAVKALAIVAAASTATALAQDSAEGIFRSLYGDEVQRVAATRETADDVVLAEQLLSATDALAEQPAMLVLLCEKAFELTSNIPAGYPTAIAAMRRLADQVPSRRIDCAGQIVEITRRQFAAAKPSERPQAAEDLIAAAEPLAEEHLKARRYADAAELYRHASQAAKAVNSFRTGEFEDACRRAESLDKNWTTIQRTKAQLDTGRESIAAREQAIRLCVVEIDDPALAADFVADGINPALAKYVPAAAKGVDAAPELACTEIAEWYHGLASDASPHARRAMLERARAYYERFLQLHTAEDLAAAKARLAVEKIQSEIDRLHRPDEGGPWIDLLKLIDPVKCAKAGQWTSQRGALTGSGAWGKIAAPVLVEGSYELDIEFTLNKGRLYIPLPLRTTATNIDVRGGRQVSARLRAVHGVSTEVNASGDPDRSHVLSVRVLQRGTAVDIHARLDGGDPFQWQGDVTALILPSKEDMWKLSKYQTPGVMQYRGSVTVSRFRLRMIDGKASLDRTYQYRPGSANRWTSRPVCRPAPQAGPPMNADTSTARPSRDDASSAWQTARS